MNYNPNAVEQWFDFAPLTSEQQNQVVALRKRYADFAEQLLGPSLRLCPCAERTVALRHLLYSKDAAIRALIAQFKAEAAAAKA